MDNKAAFAKALKQARKAKGLSQEAFSDVSSRTYVSTLERGLKSPTIEKINALAEVIGIHPLTLITLTYMFDNNELEPSALFYKVSEELKSL